VDNPKQLQLLSFCSGYGGIERGLELAGVQFKTIAHVEIEAFAIANLVAKMENNELVPAPIWTNVKTLPLEVFRERVDILTGGYPCQPFSAAGQRKGQEDFRHLFPYILKAIDVIRPRTVFFENVEGHISLGLREVIKSLEGRGYKTTWGIFSAEEVGLPHRRKRVFILGYSKLMWESQSQGGEQDKRRRTQHTGKELGNTNSKGLEGVRQCNHSQGRKASHRQLRGGDQVWPSRPSEPQHEWEEPRVTGQTEPQLGRTSNGSSSRVDRLRLLGNGVVPQTAAKAFTTLSQRLI